MQLVSTIINKKQLLVLGVILLSLNSFAQINSPYTRYGLGDVVNSQSVISAGMGGLNATYSDLRTVNFNNPASFSSNTLITLDLAVSIESRTLRSKTPVEKYNSANFSPAYIGIATPLSRDRQIGMAFGFRPITKINYSILKAERTSIDSMQTLYEGSGGTNEAFWGISKKWKNGLSLGLLTGYHFGKKDISTKRTFVNDSVAFAKADYSTSTNFGGAFLNLGVQYEFLLDTVRIEKTKTTKKYSMKLGGTFNLSHNMSASQTFERRTFEYDYSGNVVKIDSITSGNGNNGNITMPMSYSVGAMLLKTTINPSGIYDNWSLGIDYSATQWSNYRYYDQRDFTVNSWQIKIGGTYNPNFDPNSKNYLNKLNYRAGVNFGKDYINADGKELKTFSFCLGAGLPVRTTRGVNQFTTVQTAIEFGKRGSKVNAITENFFKLSVGFSLNDIWFIKRKYD